LRINEEGPLWIGLHGFTGSGADFDPLVGHFPVAISWEAPDLPGHGQPGEQEDPGLVSMEACDAMLFERLRGLGKRPIFLVGYSMGGRVALHFASRLSHLLTGVIVVGANPGIRDEREREERLVWEEELCSRLAHGGVTSFMEYWQSLPIIQTQQRLPADLVRAMWNRRIQSSALGLEQSIRGMGTGSMVSLWNSLEKIECPLLFCAGEEDGKYRQIGEEVVGKAPYGELAVVRGQVGHAAHLEGLHNFSLIVADWNEKVMASL